MEKITIYGQEIEFDIADERCAENYNRAIENYNENLAKVKTIDNPVEVVKMGNQMIRDFFYDAVGKDVLAGETNLRTSMTVYKLFLDEVRKQSESLTSMFGSAEGVIVHPNTRRPDR